MILDDIAVYRRQQLEREKSVCSPEEMKKAAEKLSVPCKDFAGALKAQGLSVIAEVKKASPSKGVIQPNFDPVSTAVQYEQAGARAVSCLTEEHYFQGSSKYLRMIREKISLPILRKDFIIDPYQIYEAKVIGADAILLISAMLDTKTIREYNKIATSLGLFVLAESHNEEELDSVLEAGCDIIGINNRNLKTFEVSLETTVHLAEKVPKGYTIVSESGIKDSEDIKLLLSCGADAVLIGETLMRSGNIAETLKTLGDTRW